MNDHEKALRIVEVYFGYPENQRGSGLLASLIEAYARREVTKSIRKRGCQVEVMVVLWIITMFTIITGLFIAGGRI